MLRLEQNARFCFPFYHILKSKFWVRNTCLTRGQTALFASLSTKFAKTIECFHSRGQNLCKFIGTKESVCIRKECNSQRIGLGHQHGRRFVVLGHQYGRRDVMWKHSIVFIKFSVGHRSIACTSLFSLSLGIYMFSFLDLVIVFFRFFMICTFFFDYPCDWHGLHVLRDHVAINTLCTFSHAFRGFLINLALLWSTPFPSLFPPVWIIRKDIERSHEIYGFN